MALVLRLCKRGVIRPKLNRWIKAFTVEPEFYDHRVLRPRVVYDHFFWHGWFIVKWFVDLQVDHLPNATNDLFLASQNKILTCYERPFQLKNDEMRERNVRFFVINKRECDHMRKQATESNGTIPALLHFSLVLLLFRAISDAGSSYNGGWAKPRFKRRTVDAFNWVEFNPSTLARRLKRTFD